MMIKPEWWEYAVFDDDGFISGIKEDAPKEVKDAYDQYQKEEKEAEKAKIKI